MTVELSVLAVSYQSAHLFVSSIEHLCDEVHHLNFEIIIVDNDSTDNTAALYQEHFSGNPNILYLQQEENLGYGAALNIAAKEASGDHLLMVNLDIRIQKDSCQRALDYLKTHPEAGGASAMIIENEKMHLTTARGEYDLLSLCIDDTLLQRVWPGLTQTVFALENFDLSLPTPLPLASGCFFMVRRHEFLRIGGFDENIFLYFEDADLSRRMAQQSLPFHYVPKVLVVHESSSGSDVSDYFRRAHWFRSLFYYCEKHIGLSQSKWMARLRFIDISLRLLFAKLKGSPKEICESHKEILGVIHEVLKR